MRPDSVILVVEDREDDIELMRRSFAHARIKNPTYFATDGQQAIDYLAGIGKFSDRYAHPMPSLILLDLKLPVVDGFEVLRWIRCSAGLSDLNVVVLTSSDDIRDVNAAYALGANSFLVKPADFDSFIELGSLIAENWLHVERYSDELAGCERDRSEWRHQKKVYLRERKSRHFYAGHRHWVPQKESAFDFERIEVAEAVATAERFREVEIILSCDQPVCELTLPIAFPGVRRA